MVSLAIVTNETHHLLPALLASPATPAPMALALHSGIIMSTRKLILSFALAAFILPSWSFAQDEHRVTVLMRNGDRVAGQLEDVEGGVAFVRVSLHDQRKLGMGDVALIDFVGGASGLPDTELSVARGPEHLTLLRDGTSLRGQFVDVRGGEAGAQGEQHRLLFRTGGGEQQIPLDRVARLYLGNFPGGTTAAAPTQAAPTFTSNQPTPAGAVRLPANAAWMPTQINVRRGDQVRFSVTGRIQLSDDPEDVAQAAGSLRQRHAAGSPLPRNFAGALIGRVGNSAPFPIGDTPTVSMPADGQLFLGINDDEVSDNRGEFIVTIIPSTTRR
jgi:hypothetical protein